MTSNDKVGLLCNVRPVPTGPSYRCSPFNFVITFGLHLARTLMSIVEVKTHEIRCPSQARTSIDSSPQSHEPSVRIFQFSRLLTLHISSPRGCGRNNPSFTVRIFFDHRPGADSFTDSTFRTIDWGVSLLFVSAIDVCTISLTICWMRNASSRSMWTAVLR